MYAMCSVWALICSMRGVCDLCNMCDLCGMCVACMVYVVYVPSCVICMVYGVCGLCDMCGLANLHKGLKQDMDKTVSPGAGQDRNPIPAVLWE